MLTVSYGNIINMLVGDILTVWRYCLNLSSERHTFGYQKAQEKFGVSKLTLAENAWNVPLQFLT